MPPMLGISEHSAASSCELRRNIKEIGENIANQFDCVKTKPESNVCKKRQYRFLVGVSLAARGDLKQPP
jgi:hypothetical protein